MAETIIIYDRNRRQVDLNTVEYIRADGNYSAVYQRGQDKPLLVCETLKVVQARLPGFIRIHKSTLVNPVHIVGIDLVANRKSGVYLSDRRTLVVSRGYASTVLAQLGSECRSSCSGR